VATDITNSILKKHAANGNGAEYWNKSEQEEKLTNAFAKWAEKGTVWSAAAQKVHQEQLKHVRKGCLERSRQDIRSDGSRIEGSHKGWNNLQRCHPSGIVMFSSLGSDHVLRRNIRYVLSHLWHSHNTFVILHSTHGSHHIDLVNNIAILHNRLKNTELRCILQPLPELPNIDSGETFGLTKSEYTSTFNGLIQVKQELADTEDDAASSDLTGSGNSDDVADLALRASRAVIFDEWRIDPTLLNQPQAAVRGLVSASSKSSIVGLQLGLLSY
ncbi:hypothetical protein PAXINDRAFT_83408, partial [Paxillus involutus ATCC 200175]